MSTYLLPREVLSRAQEVGGDEALPGPHLGHEAVEAEVEYQPLPGLKLAARPRLRPGLRLGFWGHWLFHPLAGGCHAVQALHGPGGTEGDAAPGGKSRESGQLSNPQAPPLLPRTWLKGRLSSLTQSGSHIHTELGRGARRPQPHALNLDGALHNPDATSTQTSLSPPPGSLQGFLAPCGNHQPVETSEDTRPSPGGVSGTACSHGPADLWGTPGTRLGRWGLEEEPRAAGEAKGEAGASEECTRREGATGDRRSSRPP